MGRDRIEGSRVAAGVGMGRAIGATRRRDPAHSPERGVRGVSRHDEHRQIRSAKHERVKYFVIGGRYRDTSFRELVEPEPPEGPFDRYEDALAAWRAKSVSHIDEASTVVRA
jgi:hypothetical protein